MLPAVWSVIRRELAARPGQPRNDLVARLTPSGLIRRTGADAGGVSRHVRPTITALENLGLVEADSNGGLRLSQPALSEQAFRAEVARRLLVVPDGEDPWQVRDGSQQTRVSCRTRAGLAAPTGARAADRGMAERLDRPRPAIRGRPSAAAQRRSVQHVGSVGSMAGCGRLREVADRRSATAARSDRPNPIVTARRDSRTGHVHCRGRRRDRAPAALAAQRQRRHCGCRSNGGDPRTRRSARTLSRSH